MIHVSHRGREGRKGKYALESGSIDDRDLGYCIAGRRIRICIEYAPRTFDRRLLYDDSVSDPWLAHPFVRKAISRQEQQKVHRPFYRLILATVKAGEMPSFSSRSVGKMRLRLLVSSVRPTDRPASS